MVFGSSLIQCRGLPTVDTPMCGYLLNYTTNTTLLIYSVTHWAVAATCASSRSFESFTFFTSTSNISVAFGGIRPCMPYGKDRNNQEWSEVCHNITAWSIPVHHTPVMEILPTISYHLYTSLSYLLPSPVKQTLLEMYAYIYGIKSALYNNSLLPL